MRLEFVLGAPISLLSVSAVAVGLIDAEGAGEVNVRDRHLLQIPGHYSFFSGPSDGQSTSQSAFC
jgi:hypothetical protein